MNQAQFALLNATLNGLSGILLVVAYLAVKRQKYTLHGWLMSTAIVSSAVFLVCYLLSKYLFGEQSTKQLGMNPLRILYLIILVPHVLLAVGMLPLIFITVWRAYKRDWVRHRRIARPTFWIWLYVSVTGVVIYWMLYHVFPTMAATAATR